MQEYAKVMLLDDVISFWKYLQEIKLQTSNILNAEEK